MPAKFSLPSLLDQTPAIPLTSSMPYSSDAYVSHRRWNKASTYPELLHNRAYLLVFFGLERGGRWKQNWGPIQPFFAPSSPRIRSGVPLPLVGLPLLTPRRLLFLPAFCLKILPSNFEMSLREISHPSATSSATLCPSPPSAGKSPPVSVDWAERWSGFARVRDGECGQGGQERYVIVAQRAIFLRWGRARTVPAHESNIRNRRCWTFVAGTFFFCFPFFH